MRLPVLPSGLRTGLRWKLSAPSPPVGALVALALSLVVHNAARVSMLDNAPRRAGRAACSSPSGTTRRPGRGRRFGAKIDDPELPQDLLARSADGPPRPRTWQDSADGAPDVWAAVPLADGRVLSLHTRFADRSATVLSDLDRALIIGSVSVVFGGCALGVLIGGQLSRRLRKAAAAAGKVAQGDTEVRVRDAIGGVVRDETDDLARAVDAHGRRAAAAAWRPSAGSPRTSRTSCAPR